MWSIESIENIRDDCLRDIVERYPELANKIVKPRIEINHRTTSTVARYSISRIEFSAYVFAGTTEEIFFRTSIMKGIILSQVCVLNPNLTRESSMQEIDEMFPGKYDFEEFLKHRCFNTDIKRGREESYKYVVKCPQCGTLFRYKRICKTVLNPELYVCTKCNVQLERA